MDMSYDSLQEERPDAATCKLFGENLRKYRVAKGLSQAELARRATVLLPSGAVGAVARGLISKYEQGTWPSPVYRAAIAKALGVSHADLVTLPVGRGGVSIYDVKEPPGFSAIRIDVLLPSSDAYKIIYQVKAAQARIAAASQKLSDDRSNEPADED